MKFLKTIAKLLLGRSSARFIEWTLLADCSGCLLFPSFFFVSFWTLVVEQPIFWFNKNCLSNMEQLLSPQSLVLNYYYGSLNSDKMYYTNSPNHSIRLASLKYPLDGACKMHTMKNVFVFYLILKWFLSKNADFQTAGMGDLIFREEIIRFSVLKRHLFFEINCF